MDIALVAGEVLDEFRVSQPLWQCQHKLMGFLQILSVFTQFTRMQNQILIKTKMAIINAKTLYGVWVNYLEEDLKIVDTLNR